LLWLVVIVGISVGSISLVLASSDSDDSSSDSDTEEKEICSITLKDGKVIEMVRETVVLSDGTEIEMHTCEQLQQDWANATYEEYLGRPQIADQTTTSDSEESEDNNSDDSTIPVFCSEKVSNLMGRPADRVIEVFDYLNEHQQGLGMPEWYDDPIIKCGIVTDLVDIEKSQGTTFEGDNLDGMLAMLITKDMGESASKLLENPDQYLTP
jgi:hypothetical protein